MKARRCSVCGRTGHDRRRHGRNPGNPKKRARALQPSAESRVRTRWQKLDRAITTTKPGSPANKKAAEAMLRFMQTVGFKQYARLQSLWWTPRSAWRNPLGYRRSPAVLNPGKAKRKLRKGLAVAERLRQQSKVRRDLVGIQRAFAKQGATFHVRDLATKKRRRKKNPTKGARSRRLYQRLAYLPMAERSAEWLRKTDPGSSPVIRKVKGTVWGTSAPIYEVYITKARGEK